VKSKANKSASPISIGAKGVVIRIAKTSITSERMNTARPRKYADPAG
jgi:hypothetical protein